MKTIIDKRKELEEKAALIISDNINKLLKKKDQVVFGVVGGSSVTGIYKILNNMIDWSKLKVFLIDERKVPINSEDSNYKLIKRDLKKADLIPYDYKTNASDYYKEVSKYGVFDIILLGSGEDGHVASLFPDHDSIKNPEYGYISVEDSPKLPSNRISASRKLLEKSGLAILLFFGDNKKDAYTKFKSNSSVINCPAKIVEKIKNSYVMVSE